MRLLMIGLERQEIVAVPRTLNENEGTIEHHRDDRGEYQLGRAVARPEFGRREIRQDQRKAGQRDQNREGSARPLDLEALFMMASTAREQTQSDDAVAYDHHGGEDGVTSQP